MGKKGTKKVINASEQEDGERLLIYWSSIPPHRFEGMYPAYYGRY